MSAFNDDDLDQSHVSSAEIDENTMTIPIVAEVGRDPEEEIKNLERHRRDLQDELTAIRRAMPILRDSQGKDVTQQMLELANEYQKYKNENDELHEDLERAQQELADANSENIRTRAEYKKQIREMELRCSQFEKENAELKQMIENDDRRYDESTASTLATSMFSSRENEITELKRMAMEQGAEISRLQRQLTVLDKEKQEAIQKADEFGKVLNDAEGTIEIIQQDLQTTEAENQELRVKIEELEKAISEKNVQIKKRNEAIKGFNKMINKLNSQQTTLDPLGEMESSSITNLEGTETADLCSHLLIVLKKLKSNWKENATLYQEIKEFIKEHGTGAVDSDDLESLTETFYRQADERARQIQEQYKSELEKQKNPSVLAQLRRVDQTSVSDETKLNNMSRSVSFRPAYEANVELFLDMADNNFTYAVNTGDLKGIGEQVAVLKKWCLQYFDKLKLLTNLVQTLLEELQESDEGHSILQRINDLHLDLNKTIDQSGRIFVEFEKTERNIQVAIEQSMNQTNYTNQTNQAPEVELEKDSSIAASVSELQIRNENLAKIEHLRTENTKLTERLHEIMDEKEEMVLEKNQIEQELLALRDDLQNQREAIDVVRTELDEATQKQHIVTEDFDRYRQSTEEHNKQLETRIIQLKNYVENIRETLNAIESNNTLIEIKIHPSEITEDEHKKLWESLERNYELQNANLEYDHLLEKEQAEHIHDIQTMEKEKAELKKQLSQVIEEFERHREQIVEDNMRRAELIERNNAILEERLKAGDFNTSASTSAELEVNSWTQVAKLLVGAQERTQKITNAVEDIAKENHGFDILVKECRRLLETIQQCLKWLEERKENYPPRTAKLLQKELPAIFNVMSEGASEISKTFSRTRVNKK
uniref:Uncharacterized protein n=1 Tax=Acrobeloides nanus TaxID=290746 RepID=A0A914C2W2_9BILA